MNFNKAWGNGAKRGGEKFFKKPLDLKLSLRCIIITKTKIDCETEDEKYVYRKH